MFKGYPFKSHTHNRGIKEATGTEFKAFKGVGNMIYIKIIDEFGVHLDLNDLSVNGRREAKYQANLLIEEIDDFKEE